MTTERSNLACRFDMKVISKGYAKSHGELRIAHDIKANKGEVQLIEVKFCEDTVS